MKKSLVAICCILVMALMVPFASYAREASDTTLFINSDSTDIYSNSVRKVYSKTFSSLDKYGEMYAWSFVGAYDISDDEGVVFNDNTASAIYDEQQFDGTYLVKYNAKNGYRTLFKAFFNYQDSQNGYYVGVNGYKGIVTINKLVSGTKTVVDTKTISELEVVSSDSMLEFTLEVCVEDGNAVSVWYVLDGNRVNVFDKVALSSAAYTSGKVGVGYERNNYSASVKSIKVYHMPEEDVSNVSNTIKGKIVTYKDMGNALVAVAFYDESKLVDVFTKRVSLSEGINDFSIDILSEENLVGTDIKYFLFDSLSNVKPLVVTKDNSNYRNGGFSDALEPYYPMASAASKTVDDMYAWVADDAIIANSLESEIADRTAVIDMYKKAGFDITADLNDYMQSSVLRAHAPQTYSTLTPKPLMGNYEQPYSIDAPWNNPIPKDNPRTEITTWKDTGVSLQFSVVRPKGATSGNGLGIPVIIADENDGFERFANKYSANDWSTVKGALVRVPDNYGDMLNDISIGDRHAVFIDDTTKLGFQTWQTVPSTTSKGYDWTSGLVRDFDARAGSVTSFIDLTGIGNEGHAGVNAAGVPMDAITIKPTDLDDDGEDINHALAAAFSAVMRARVYPAYDMDYGVMKNETAVGCVPYGGITQLDPSLDLEGMYADGKLSLPGYKVLKAWRDYGLYNIDQITSDLSRGGMMVYTSTQASDWKDESNSKYTVPKSGSQGQAAVEAEIEAVISGDSYYGLTEPVAIYVTVPNVKYTSYDANDDGSIDNDDATVIAENIGKIIVIDNEACDINKDGEITNRDVELVNKYLNGEYPQSPKEYAITAKYAQSNSWQGNVRIATGSRTVNNYGSTTSYVNSTTTYVPEGEYYSVAAFPMNGYVFDSWVNEELAGVTSNVVNVKATSDAYYSAIFKRAPKVTVVYEKNDDGEGTIGFTSSKSGGYTTKAYGTSTDIKYGNYQCAFKATPADGYVFESWEVTADGATKTSHSHILNAYINSDTNIKANFKKANAYDVFDSLDTSVWEPVVAVGSSGFTPEAGKMYASVSGGTFNFTNSALNKTSNYIVINNSAISLGNTTLITTVKAGNKENGNKGKVVFGYKDTTNYWYVDFTAKTDEVRLIQVADGKSTIHATYTRDDSSTLDLSANADIHVKTTSEGLVSVYVYQGENEYVLAENLNAGAVITGKMGLGTAYASHIYFDNFAVIAN